MGSKFFCSRIFSSMHQRSNHNKHHDKVEQLSGTCDIRNISLNHCLRLHECFIWFLSLIKSVSIIEATQFSVHDRLQTKKVRPISIPTNNILTELVKCHYFQPNKAPVWFKKLIK